VRPRTINMLIDKQKKIQMKDIGDCHVK